MKLKDAWNNWHSGGVMVGANFMTTYGDYELVAPEQPKPDVRGCPKCGETIGAMSWSNNTKYFCGKCDVQMQPKPEPEQQSEPTITALDEAIKEVMKEYVADGGLLRRKAIFDLKKFGYIDPRTYVDFMPNSELEEDERAISIWMRGYVACCEQSPVATEIKRPQPEQPEPEPKPEPEAEQDVGFKSLDPYIVGVMRELIKQERERLVRLLRKHHHWAIRELADELKRGGGEG